MIHAREDYNRIQDPATDPSFYIDLPEGCTPIAQDEPVFLLRAQDRLMNEMLAHYLSLLMQAGASTEMRIAVRAHATRVREWQDAHGCKVPDL